MRGYISAEVHSIDVANYVKTKNRRALSDLPLHRRKVLDELQAISAISPAIAVEDVLDKLAVIRAGLEEFKPLPGSLPRERVALAVNPATLSHRRPQRPLRVIRCRSTSDRISDDLPVETNEAEIARARSLRLKIELIWPVLASVTLAAPLAKA
ncbi:hypothetical protein [Bradyrhizobium sp. 76]|uniref:hypothetical protein n=1 Tax=Bradyrhizobium sp. 76 TaxID=2782680 RepID=UPI001FFA5C67|nr:hypothetical protein [Bradyrhizobium sp. 76]MCK1406136.1 hypothetical protein [Bradyrhizobium sp. 76]